jgi:hypothetical protein
LTSDLDPFKLRLCPYISSLSEDNQCFQLILQGYSKIQIFQKKKFFGIQLFPLRKTGQGVVDGGCDLRMNCFRLKKINQKKK